jgi:hypothetical protein
MGHPVISEMLEKAGLSTARLRRFGRDDDLLKASPLPVEMTICYGLRRFRSG